MADPLSPEEERRLLASAAADIDANLLESFGQVMALIEDGVPPKDAIAQVLSQIEGDMAAVLAVALTKVVGEAVSSADALALNVGPMRLSPRLYAESAQVSEVVSGIVTRHLGGFADSRRLALELFEGYAFRTPSDEPLQFKATNERLPRYLRDLLRTEPGIERALASKVAAIQVQGLKTEALRASYTELLQAIADAESGIGKAGLRKRLEIAWFERMRYFAQRIAQTEIHRAYMKRLADDLMADADVQFVQVRRAPGTQDPCICTLYTGRDRYGLGPGVYPKAKAPLPPYHPYCRCVVSPRLDLTGRAVPTDEDVAKDVSFLRRLDPSVSARIVGSKAKLGAVLDGSRTADAIQEASAGPGYRVRLVGEAPQSVPI